MRVPAVQPPLASHAQEPATPTVAAPAPSTSANRTGLPNQIKAGVAALSGLSLDAVKVHYNSSKPAQLSAHAYAQATDIHLAPGQEKHLPHETWHVFQQAQGRFKPTRQLKRGVSVNDDAELEREADVMGARALANSASQQRSLSQSRGSAKKRGSSR